MPNQPTDQNNQQNPQDQNNQQDQQQAFTPYAAFLATMPRDFDPAIYNLIASLVDQRYGADLNAEARKFEIARVYCRVEIEIYEATTFALSKDKQVELQRMTEEAQKAGGDQQKSLETIREYMSANVPNVGKIVEDYMLGFRYQYMAGRY